MVFDYINAGIDGNIFFYCSDLIKSDIGGNKGYGFISGKWLNGADFTIDIGTYETYSQVVLVPEPFTILFFIGGIFLFQKRKH